MEANSFADQWFTQAVLDRLKENGERAEAQGKRITDLAERERAHDDRLSKHNERLTAVETAVVEIKTQIKMASWALGIAIPIASAVLFKVIG